MKSNDTTPSTYDLTPLPAAERDALAAGLSDEERRVILHQGTERPFCGGLLNEKRAGVFNLETAVDRSYALEMSHDC